MKKVIMLLCAMIALISIAGCVVDIDIEFGDSTELAETVETVPALLFLDTEESAKWYFYNQLTDKEKVIYCEILNQVHNFSTEIKFKEYDLIGEYLSQEAMWKIEMAFSQDHPQYFWTTQYLAINRVNDITYIDYRNVAQNEIKETFDSLNNLADEFISGIPETSTEYEKVKCIYEYVLQNTKFDFGAKYDQDIRGVLLEHKSVCNGYAYTFKFLCDKANIPCIIANGYSNNGKTRDAHAWNAVQIDGNWYWVDTTWGDTTDKEDYYLCMTDDEIFKTHDLRTMACDIKLNSTMHFVFPNCIDKTY